MWAPSFDDLAIVEMAPESLEVSVIDGQVVGSQEVGVGEGSLLLVGEVVGLLRAFEAADGTVVHAIGDGRPGADGHAATTAVVERHAEADQLAESGGERGVAIERSLKRHHGEG